MGKKVLRPGGRELTEKLIDELQIRRDDEVVEFAPGMGFTAALLGNKSLKSYTGVELNEEVFAKLQRKFEKDERFKFLNRSASASQLASNSADKLIGEAMLTMQADHRKAEIMAEAHRVLKLGGLYGIHELALQPDEIPAALKEEIRMALAQTAKVNARPLTKNEWGVLLSEQGFEVKTAFVSPMHLLEPHRIISDEGIIGAMNIATNLMARPKAKKKVAEMRALFKKYENYLTAIAIVAEKKNN